MRCDRCEKRAKLVSVVPFQLNPHDQPTVVAGDCQAWDLCAECIGELTKAWEDFGLNQDQEA